MGVRRRARADILHLQDTEHQIFRVLLQVRLSALSHPAGSTRLSFQLRRLVQDGVLERSIQDHPYMENSDSRLRDREGCDGDVSRLGLQGVQGGQLPAFEKTRCPEHLRRKGEGQEAFRIHGQPLC